METLYELVSMAWGNTWTLAGGAVSFLFPVICTVIAVYIAHRWRGQDEAKSRMYDIGIGVVAFSIVFALVLLFNVLLFAPLQLYNESKDELELERIEAKRTEENAATEMANIQSRLLASESKSSQLERDNQELRDKLADAREARPIKVDAVPQSMTPLPSVAGVTITKRQIPSPRQDASYALELTIQTQAELSPFKIGLTFEKPIVEAVSGIVGQGLTMVQTSKSGTLPDRTYIARIEKLTPQAPLIIKVFANEPITVIDVTRLE